MLAFSLLIISLFWIQSIFADSASTAKLIKKFSGQEQQFISGGSISCGPHRRLLNGVCVHDRSSTIAAINLDPRKCDSDSDSVPRIKDAYGLCVDDVCQVYCQRGTFYYNGECSPIKSTPTPNLDLDGNCQTDSDCETNVPFGISTCFAGHCSTGCAPNFIKVGTQCERALRNSKRGVRDHYERSIESQHHHHHPWKRSSGDDPNCPIGYRTAFAEGVYFCKPIKK